MIFKYYNLVLDSNKNGLSDLPNMVKFQLMTLSYLYVLVWHTTSQVIDWVMGAAIMIKPYLQVVLKK